MNNELKILHDTKQAVLNIINDTNIGNAYKGSKNYKLEFEEGFDVGVSTIGMKILTYLDKMIIGNKK